MTDLCLSLQIYVYVTQLNLCRYIFMFNEQLNCACVITHLCSDERVIFVPLHLHIYVTSCVCVMTHLYLGDRVIFVSLLIYHYVTNLRLCHYTFIFRRPNYVHVVTHLYLGDRVIVVLVHVF